jgi:dihydroflavonol-4-reductase
MRLFITGATGFIGAEIVRQAVAAGHTVTALRRKTSSTRRLDGVPVTWVIGDVTDAETVREGMRGADACIHAAGDTSYYLRDRKRLEAINVGGVRNVLRAAKDTGVRSIVHTSSVAAIGYDPKGGIATEDTPFNWPAALPYMRTKRDGEQLMREAAGEGMRIVILNPVTVLGPGGMNYTEEQMVKDIRDGKLGAAPPGGMTVCWVDDVAAAHLAALERGRSGERYILGGPSVTHRELFAALARALGVPEPRSTLPGWLCRVAGGALLGLEAIGLRFATSATVPRLARLSLFHGSDKAIAELGYRTRSLDEIVRGTVPPFVRASASASA